MKLIIKDLQNKATRKQEHFLNFVVNSSELFFKIQKNRALIIYHQKIKLSYEDIYEQIRYTIYNCKALYMSETNKAI